MARAVNDRSPMSSLAERAVARTPRRLALRFGSMSDRAIAWLFITPSVLLLQVLITAGQAITALPRLSVVLTATIIMPPTTAAYPRLNG